MSIYNTILIVLALVSSIQGLQISHKLQQKLAQVGWQGEVTNNFTWTQTQKLQWTVLNAFVDVQVSPDGDIYAIQEVEGDSKAYYGYKYNSAKNEWNRIKDGFQIKAVRFDKLGKVYYLGGDNCIYDDNNNKLICQLKDFEVRADGKIIALSDGTGTATSSPGDTNFETDQLSSAQYQIYSSDLRGLTLLNEKPIFLDNLGKSPADFNQECLVSISAGYDNSIWGLGCQDNTDDYQVLKWNPEIKKWYKIKGAKAKYLSAYNEISVAIVDSKGLLSLSSSSGNQKEAFYTDHQLIVRNSGQDDTFDNKLIWAANQISEDFDIIEKCFDSTKTAEQQAISSFSNCDSDHWKNCTGKGPLFILVVSDGATILAYSENGFPQGSFSGTTKYYTNGKYRFFELGQKQAFVPKQEYIPQITSLIDTSYFEIGNHELKINRQCDLPLQGSPNLSQFNLSVLDWDLNETYDLPITLEGDIQKSFIPEKVQIYALS